MKPIGAPRAPAQACRTFLTALGATTGELLATPTVQISPIASMVGALRGVPPEQLLDLAIAKLRSALPRTRRSRRCVRSCSTSFNSPNEASHGRRHPRRAARCHHARSRSQHRLRPRRAQRDSASPFGQADPFQPQRAHAMVGFVVVAGREGRAVTMPLRRDPGTNKWFFRTIVKLPNGEKLRVSGTPGIPGPYHDPTQTKQGAVEAEQRAIKDLFTPKLVPEEKKEVPTFSEWFDGRFWNEWVIGRRNKPGEARRSGRSTAAISRRGSVRCVSTRSRRQRSRVSAQTSWRRTSATSASTTSSRCCPSRCVTRSTAS